MKLFKQWILLSVLFTAVFAACTSAAETTATPAPEDNNPGNVLANTQWMLQSFGATGAETPVIEGTAVTLEFASNGQAGGSGGSGRSTACSG